MSRHNHPAVPTIREVIPGAGVNIVLKQDQPTGRTVSGVVREVLTRGNHPRGIKVRLADGRVGRVQSMLSGYGTVAASAEAGIEAFAGDAGGPDDADLGAGGMQRRDRGRGRRMDMRMEEDVPLPQVGLDAYIKPARQKGGMRKGNGGWLAGSGSLGLEASAATASHAVPDDGVVRCPVCDDFEGDEAAVAHHVASHFDA